MIRGHTLTAEWNGEPSRKESAWTGTCKCGYWEESGSTRKVVREEYRFHLADVREHPRYPIPCPDADCCDQREVPS